MHELELLNTKLDTLLKKYTVLQDENATLKETVNKQMKSIETLNSKLVNLEENMANSGLSSTMDNDKEKAMMRKQLDNVIGEIDKILTTLND